MDPAIEVTETQAIVEAIRITRRAEESARMFIMLSVPVKGAEQQLAFLAGNLKNPINLSFQAIQGRLLQDGNPPETETVEMTVDGADKQKVTRAKRNGNGTHPAADEDPDRCDAGYDGDRCILDRGHEGMHSTTPTPEVPEISALAQQLIDEAAETPATV